jgi:hypothetical protein
MTSRLKLSVLIVALVVGAGCSGGGGKSVPSPLGPGETLNVTLCGSTSEPTSPCPNFPDNAIQIRVSPADGSQQCPCFNFAFLNQNLNDLGTPTRNYEFTGFRPGTYTVTGDFNTRGMALTFWHNTSTSTIGVVPSSLQSLTGPVVASSGSCRIDYNTGSSLTRTTVPYSFQFTIAAATSGGTC